MGRAAAAAAAAAAGDVVGGEDEPLRAAWCKLLTPDLHLIYT
jgi:hypothetical protein